MPAPTQPPLLLSNARPSDFAGEIKRRMSRWLASLPDGREWTRMDVVFAGIVAMLALSSTGFFTASYRIWANDPDYFSQRFIASMQALNKVDMIETGTVAASAAAGLAGGVAGALPVPRVVRAQEPKPSDYEIVMIFGDEALLATAKELVRAKVGSILPGLGAVLSIGVDGIDAQNASLRVAEKGATSSPEESGLPCESCR